MYRYNDLIDIDLRHYVDLECLYYHFFIRSVFFLRYYVLRFPFLSVLIKYFNV